MEEEIQGRPFVGPSGKLLSLVLERTGFNRAEIAIVNAVQFADICKHGFRIDVELFHKNKAFVMEQAALLHHELLAEIPHSILQKHHEK